MPGDDFVLNVRQIGSYPLSTVDPSSDALIAQRGGLGGPYVSLDVAETVAGALIGGPPLQVGLAAPGDAGGGTIFTESISTGLTGWWGWNAYIPQGAGAAAYASSGAAGLMWLDGGSGWWWQWAPPGTAGDTADFGFQMNLSPSGYLEVADQIHVKRDPAGPLEVATAQWVSEVIAATTVSSVNGRRGDIMLSVADIPGAVPAWNGRLEGCPTASTPVMCDCSDRIATTAFVHSAIVGSIQNLLCYQPFVFSFNGRTGDVTLQASDIANLQDVFNDATLTGTPTAPTPSNPEQADNQVATTAFVQLAIADAADEFAPINSPVFTGYPQGPTAPPGTDSGQLATTAFVTAAVTEATTGVVSFNTRTGAVTLQSGDITAAGGALLASPVFTGTPQGPTAAPGTSNATLATTAFVAAAIASVEGVASFNTRTGAVTLSTADITGAGGAPIASPVFTGVPAGPTAAPGTSTTQLATTAFVTAAVSGSVSSFNGRGGAITLTSADISAATGALLASPAFTGTPTGPTAATGTNTNQLATTAFVYAALATAGGVDSFNGRAGVVTLTSGDITGAGGALQASLAAYLPLAGGTLTGALTPSAAGIVGVTNGSNAAAGSVGEYITASGSNPVPAAATPVNLVSINLTPGDWDVTASFLLQPASTATIANFTASLSTTSATTNNALPYGPTAMNVTLGAGGLVRLPLGVIRFNVSVATTIYLVVTASVGGTGGTTGTGYIGARRAR